jgi:phosphohistidine phosphatase
MSQTRLYLMRHGDAGDSASWKGDDFERPLTDRGRARTLAMAEHLDAIGVAPRRVITSPLARAAQTAAIVAEVIGGVETLVQDDRLGQHFGMEGLARILDDNRDAEALLLVGHEPTLSSALSDVIGGGEILMKKGAVAAVDIVPGAERRAGRITGTLVWLLSPGSLGL